MLLLNKFKKSKTKVFILEGLNISMSYLSIYLVNFDESIFTHAK